MSSDEKILKRSFQNNRKTLKSLPVISVPDGGGSFQYFPLCMYFSRINTLDLEKQLLFYGDLQPMSKIFRSFERLLNGSRFVENLRVLCQKGSDSMMIIKKLDGSRRLLSSLKTLELQITGNMGIYESRDLLMELIRYKEFLRHVTHLKIGEIESGNEMRFEWEIVQFLISFCPQIRCLWFSQGQVGVDDRYDENLNQEFWLDLNCLEHLQILEIEVTDLKAFMNGIEFPSSHKEVILKIEGAAGSNSLKELFNEGSDVIVNQEEQDLRDWQSFENHKILSNFFNKWKKQKNLKVLSLYLWAVLDVDLFVKKFVFPLLGAIPQLETFGWMLRSREINSKPFDLEEFLFGIGSLHPLKNLEIETDRKYDCLFSGRKCLNFPSLSSIEVEVDVSSNFNLEKFFNP